MRFTKALLTALIIAPLSLPDTAASALPSRSTLAGAPKADTTGATKNATSSPTLSLTTSTYIVLAGQSVTLFWSSTNALSCSASGGASGAWGGPKSANGSQTIMPTHTGTYTLTCTGKEGTTIRSVTVQVFK